MVREAYIEVSGLDEFRKLALQDKSTATLVGTYPLYLYGFGGKALLIDTTSKLFDDIRIPGYFLQQHQELRGPLFRMYNGFDIRKECFYIRTPSLTLDEEKTKVLTGFEELYLEMPPYKINPEVPFMLRN